MLSDENKGYFLDFLQSVFVCIETKVSEFTLFQLLGPSYFIVTFKSVDDNIEIFGEWEDIIMEKTIKFEDCNIDSLYNIFEKTVTDIITIITFNEQLQQEM